MPREWRGPNAPGRTTPALPWLSKKRAGDRDFSRRRRLPCCRRSCRGEEDLRPATAVLVRSSLARAHHYSGRFDLARACADRALEIARSDEDAMARMHALAVAAQVRVPMTSNDVVAVAEFAGEAWDLRFRVDDLDDVATITEYALQAELARGDGAASEIWFGRLLSLTEVVNTRFTRYVFMNNGHVRSFLAGDLEDAEERARAAYELGHQLREDLSGVYGTQMFAVRREMDRLAEVEPVLRLGLSDSGGSATWRPGLVILLAELGMTSQAKEELGDLLAGGLEGQGHDSLWPAALCFLAEASWKVDCPEHARALRPLLTPWKGLGAAVGHHVSHLGSTDRYLAMLARTVGCVDEAELLLESALAFNRALGSTLWESHTLMDLAELRVQQHRKQEAIELAGAAVKLAVERGLHRVKRRYENLGL